VQSNVLSIQAGTRSSLTSGTLGLSVSLTLDILWVSLTGDGKHALRRLDGLQWLADVWLSLSLTNAHWRLSVSSLVGRSGTNDTGVDGTRNTVVNLQVQLWDLVLWVNRGLLHITLGGSLDDVAHLESLDRLILGDRSVTVGACDWLDVASTTSVLATIATLSCHDERGLQWWQEPKWSRPREAGGVFQLSPLRAQGQGYQAIPGPQHR